MARENQYCFFIDLKTRCLIIGYFNLIVAIIEIVLTIFFLVGAAGLLTVQDQDPSVQEINKKLKSIGAILVSVTVVVLVFLMLLLAFTIVLLVGLHQNKRGLVKVYLIYGLVYMGLSVIIFFASFGAHVTTHQIFWELFHILLRICFLLVIRSYYLKMDDPTTKPIISNTA